MYQNKAEYRKNALKGKLDQLNVECEDALHYLQSTYRRTEKLITDTCLETNQTGFREKYLYLNQILDKVMHLVMTFNLSFESANVFRDLNDEDGAIDVSLAPLTSHTIANSLDTVEKCQLAIKVNDDVYHSSESEYEEEESSHGHGNVGNKDTNHSLPLIKINDASKNMFSYKHDASLTALDPVMKYNEKTVDLNQNTNKLTLNSLLKQNNSDHITDNLEINNSSKVPVNENTNKSDLNSMHGIVSVDLDQNQTVSGISLTSYNFSISRPNSLHSNVPLPSFEIGSVWNMNYGHGNSLWDFWLTLESVDQINKVKELILYRKQWETLKKLSNFPVDGDFVCCVNVPKNGRPNVFRGKVCSVTHNDLTGSIRISVFDVDTGQTKYGLDSSQIFVLDEDIKLIPAQAINCRLNGDFGDPSDETSNQEALISELKHFYLTVTICGVTRSDPPIYSVDITVHRSDYCSNNLSFNFNSWAKDSLNNAIQSSETNIRSKPLKSSPLFENTIYNYASKELVIEPMMTNSTLQVNNHVSEQLLRKGDEFKHLLICPAKLDHQKENVLKGLVVHIISPQEFYVNFEITASYTERKALQDIMVTHYSKTKNLYESKSQACKIIGKYCACFYTKDHTWRRVEVLDWKLEDYEGFVHVSYLDYGEVAEVSYNLLQCLLPEFVQLPALANKCSLSSVFPLGSTFQKIVKDWQECSLEAFKVLVDVDTMYDITIVPLDQFVPVGSLSVKLVDSSKEENRDIIKEFVDDWQCGVSLTLPSVALALPRLEQAPHFSRSDQAAYLPCSSSAVKDSNECLSDNTIFEEDNPMKEDFEAPYNTYDHDIADPCFAATGYKPLDEFRVCKFYRENGVCRRINCSKDHEILHHDGWTTDKSCIYSEALHLLALPKEGELIDVMLVSIESISFFYVVKYSEEKEDTDGSDEDGKEEDEETLVKLNNFINKPENVKAMKCLTVAPAVGQLVLAKWPHDGRWYRAKVLQPGIEVQVQFVDFGNKDVVPEINIRQIEPRYLHLPFQAIRCTFANFKKWADLTEEQHQNALMWLNELVNISIFKIKVISYDDGELGVLLFNNNLDVGSMLVEYEFGQRQDFVSPPAQPRNLYHNVKDKQ